DSIPSSAQGRTALLDKFNSVAASVISRLNLGQIVGDAIKDRLGLPDSAFELTISYVDADSGVAGFQGAAVVELDIDKTVTKTFGFDFNLPDLGPVSVSTGANLDVTVGGHLDLDFGFRLDTFTPYLLNTTDVSLTASIDSNIGVTAGIAGISGGLNGNLKLRGSTSQNIGTGLTSFQLANNPIDNLIVVTRNDNVLTRGNLLSDPGVDYILNSSTNPPTIQFVVATSGSTAVEYTTTAPALDDASIGLEIDPTLVPSDGNTIGGIPFSQLFSTTIPLENKFDFGLNGIATASLDANLAGLVVDDAITVVLSLDHPGDIEVRFDGIKNYLAGLSDLSQLNLSQVIAGIRAVLNMVDSGLKSDLLEKLPLISNGLDLGSSFVGKLQNMVDQLETTINNATGTIDAKRASIQQTIFDALGPSGANILKLNPLIHNDPNVADNVEVGDVRDVEVLIPNPLTTPAEDLELGINLHLAGSDTIMADFDLGIDSLAFGFNTSGGLKLNFGYDFSFGFGVNLQKGFFFQLNPNVTYSGGLPLTGTPEVGLKVDVMLEPGTTLGAKLFFLNISATSNPIEDYNRDGILNNGGVGVNEGPVLNEALDKFDYNRDGDQSDLLTESDVDANGRLSKGTGLVGNLFFDILDPVADPDNRLYFSDFAGESIGDLFNAGLTTEAFVDLHLSADVGSSSLPKIEADFTLDWAIGLTSQDGIVGGGFPEIAIHDVKLDLGSFLTTVIQPIFESYKKYVGPVRPLIELLASPVPGLNDLSQLVGGPELTFVTLGLLGGSQSAQTAELARNAKRIVGLLKEAFLFADELEQTLSSGDDIVINFGTFYLTGKPQAVNNTATTGSGVERQLPSNPRTGTPVRVFDNAVEVARNLYTVVRYRDAGVPKTKIVFNTAPTGTITATYSTVASALKDFSNGDTPLGVSSTDLDTTLTTDPNGGVSSGVLGQSSSSGEAGAAEATSLLKRLTGDPDSNGKGGFGIKIPLLADPSKIFKLFTGEKVDIIQWDIPKLELNVPFSMQFGPIPFPPVPLFATFDASLDAFVDFSVGFDTRGIAKTGKFFDGLYFGDLAQITTGEDIDEFGLGLEATVGAAIKIPGLGEAGIEGGVRADLGLNWNDLDKDGKIYIDELIDLFSLQPSPPTGVSFPGMCVFDAHGSIDAFVRAYYDVILLGSDSFTIADINLFSFNHSCPAPGVAELGADGTLTLFAGDDAGKRSTIYGTDPNETFEINQTIESSVTTTHVKFHFLNRDGDPDSTLRSFTGVQRIFFSGGSGNDTVTVDASVTVPVTLKGGAGNDVLIGGSADDVLIGDAGNDIMTGGLGNDRYVFASGWGVDDVIETNSSTDLNDILDMSGVNAALNTTLTAQGLAMTAGANVINGGRDASNNIVQVAGIERVIGGSAMDSFVVQATIGTGNVNNWTLQGKNRGNINSAFQFEGFENLTGGDQDDRFVVQSNGSSTGTLNGMGGNDTLDYSTFVGSPVVINRQTRVANQIAQFLNMEVFRGGTGTSDVLIGRKVVAEWNITAVNDGNVLDAASTVPVSFFGFENVTGGDSNDTFNVAANGRLTGKLLGTFTAGHGDTDKVDFASHTVNLRVNVNAIDQGNVQLGASQLIDFSSVESVTTGSGDDSFVMTAGSGLSGQTNGGSGARDLLDYSAFSNAVAVNLNTGANQIGTVSGIEDVTGGAGSDSITGNNLGNRLIGMDGADTIVSLNGDDILIGDSALITMAGSTIASIRLLNEFSNNDTMTAGTGNNWILPGLGNDTVTAGNGNNIVAGDLVLLTLSGGQVTSIQSLNSGIDGNDSITIGTGNDLILAGNGNDSIGAGDGRNVVVADRGSIILANGLPTTARSFISVLSGTDTINAGTGNDTILAGGNADSILGGAGNNFIVADDGIVTFVAGTADSVSLTPSTNDGNDSVTTLSGNDVIYTGNGDNTANAGDGDDDAIGGSGIDLLNGQGGNDFLVGMLGDDTIDGNTGNDVMFGGQPIGTRNNYRFGTGDFTQPLDFAAMNALYPTGYTLPLNITPSIVAGLSVDGVVGDGRDLLIGFDGNDVMFGGSDVDNLNGGNGFDYIDAGAGNDINLDGGADDDVVRGGAGEDVVHGGLGIDQLYGDDGDDHLFGDAGSNTSSTGVQAGQRLFGGAGRDTLFAFAPSVANLIAFNSQLTLVGDQLFGGSDGDFLNGNIRQETLIGDAGNDFIAGDIFIGSTYLTHTAAGIGTQADTHGANDLIHGGSGEDQLYGGGGNDTMFGGAGTDLIEGQRGADIQRGGSGIDLFTIRTDEPAATDTIDGHFGNDVAGDVADDNATDIAMINGTAGNDTILIGGDSGVATRALVRFNSVNTPVTMRNSSGNLLVEQFRIAGLAGNDTIGFYTLSALDSGVVTAPPAPFVALNTTELANRSSDYIGVFDGNSGNDILLGSAGRDQMDGGLGSDVLYGFAGDDRLLGDIGNGSTSDQDILYSGGGNDDLIGGLGTNKLFAWSFNPKINVADQFGVFVDSTGRLFNNDGGGIRQLEDDELFGGTVVDFMFGNGGTDILYRADGSTLESLDEGLGDDAWKQYARASDQVWYVGGTNADDQIDVNFVTEPGVLTDHHLITRLTNNNGNFSFAAQVRLDFDATDAQGNQVFSEDRLKFRVDQLLANADPNSRETELVKISQSTEDLVTQLLLNSIVPPEGDFQVILIDALGGNDQVTVGPTVQKSVWVDGGAGDDRIEIRAGNAILVDKTESSSGPALRGRNDIPAQAFRLTSANAGQLIAVDGTLANVDGLEFNGLTMDSPTDVDWYRFTLAANASPSSVIQLASGSPIDSLGLQIFNTTADPNVLGTLIQTGTSTGSASSVSMNGLVAGTQYLLKVTTPNLVPTTYSLRFNLTGTSNANALAAIPMIDLGIRSDSARRQDVILGGIGDDILLGGAGEDWIFGMDGNDVLTGGYDRQASDLLFGGNGNDTFQIIPDRLPLLGNQPDTDFDPASRTFIPTFSDQMLGGAGADRVLYLGGDTDRRGFDVPDFVAVQYNTGLHRYEFASLAWDIGTQAFRTTTDGNGNNIFEQHYQYFQTRDVEVMSIETGAGNDVVHADGGFAFTTTAGAAIAGAETWGFERGDLEQNATLAELRIDGGAGNDALFGGPYTDTIVGGSGNDYIVGNLGDDNVSGGTGADTIHGNAQPVADTVGDVPATFALPSGFPVGVPAESYIHVMAAPYANLPAALRPGVDLSIPAPAIFYDFANSANSGLDVSGSGIHAGNTDVVTELDPERGQVAFFEFPNSVLTIPGSNGSNLGSTWTFSAWFQSMVNDGSENVLFGGSGQEAFATLAAGTANLGARTSAGTFTDSGADLVAASLGTLWHQLTVVYRVVVGSSLRYFLDGKFVGSVNIPSEGNLISIGNNAAGNASFASFLDDVALFNQALTDDQVRLLFDDGATLRADVVNDAHVIQGPQRGDQLSELRSAGDFNGDGREDFIASSSARSYLFFGPMQISDVHNVVDLSDIVIEHSALGHPGAKFGDVNNDGLSDLAFVRSDGDDYVITIVYGGPTSGILNGVTTPWARNWDDAFVSTLLNVEGDGIDSRTIRIQKSELNLQELPTLQMLDMTGDDQAEVVVSTTSTFGAPSTGTGSRMGYVYSGTIVNGFRSTAAKPSLLVSDKLAAIDFGQAVGSSILVGANARLPIVAAGDLNGDGVEELVFGNRQATVNTFAIAPAIFTAPNTPTNTGLTSSFTLAVNGVSTTIATFVDSRVVSPGDLTATANAFVGDINAKIEASPLNGRVFVRRSATNRLEFVPVDGGTNTSLLVSALANPTEIGLVSTSTINTFTVTPNLAFGSSPSSLFSSQSVAQAGRVVDVNVTVNINHTWDSDVRVSLIAPNSAAFPLLITSVGGSGDNFTSTKLDDEAAASISSGTPPFTGSFRPFQSLSIFDGTTAAGTWQLFVEDAFPTSDNGTLVSWTLELTIDNSTPVFGSETLIPHQSNAVPMLPSLTDGVSTLVKVSSTNMQSVQPVALGDLDNDGLDEVGMIDGNALRIHRGTNFNAAAWTIAGNELSVSAGHLDTGFFGEVIVTGRPTHSIPLGNLFDDFSGELASIILTDAYADAVDANNVGVDKIVQGGASSFSLTSATIGTVNFNFSSIGWTGATQGTISNDAVVSTQTSNVPVPISTQKYENSSNQVNLNAEIEEGLSISSNSALTFDLDEIRAAGDLSSTELLRFVADRVGPNDALPVGSIQVHAVVIVGDASGVLTGFVNGVPVAVTQTSGTFQFTGTIPSPLVRETFTRFNVPIPANAKFVTLAAVKPSGSIAGDDLAWSGARLEIDSRGIEFERTTHVIHDIGRYGIGTLFEFPTTASTLVTPGIDARQVGVRFDGINDLLTLPSSVLDNLGELTASIRFSSDSSMDQTLINASVVADNGATFVPNTFDVSLTNQDGQRFLRITSGNFNPAFFAITNLSDGQSHLLTITLSDSANTVSAFVDGELIGTSSLAVNLVDVTANELILGRAKNGASTFGTANAAGTMSELSIFERVLSPAEIAELARAGLRGDEIGLHAWYRFAESSGDAVVDSTGRHGNGTLGLASIADSKPVRVANYEFDLSKTSNNVVDLNGDRISDVVIAAAHAESLDQIAKAGVLYVAGSNATRVALPTNFDVLENISVAGSGSFLVDRGTGVPESFSVLAISAQVIEKYFQFSTLGDGMSGNTIRASGATATFLDSVRFDLIDADGHLVQRGVESISLRAVPAGMYFLRVAIVGGFTTPFVIEITPPARGQSHETSTHPDRDILHGDDGNDLVVGNDDFDKLFGGSGADQFTGEPIEIHDRDVLDLPIQAVLSSQTTFGNSAKDSDPIIGLTTTTAFEDNFETGSFAAARWQLVTNASIDGTGVSEPSGSFSARLNGQPAGNDSFSSVPINLLGASRAVLTYSFQRTGGGDSPETNEDLILEFSIDGKPASDVTKVWIELDRQLGSGPDMQTYSRRQLALPDTALKTTFQFRFRSLSAASASALDDWFIDDVSVARTDGSIEFLAAIANELAIPVTTSAGLAGTSSLFFDGNDSLQVTPDTALNGGTTGDFSIEMWIRPQNNGAVTRPLISTLHDSGTSKRGYGLFLSPSNQIQFYTGNGSDGTSSAWEILNGPTIPMLAWTHIAATFDATSGPLSGAFTGLKNLYINGNPIPAATATQLFEPNTVASLRSGANAAIAGTYVGHIDEIRVWNVPLSAGTIEAQHKTTISPGSSGLQGYWRLDELTGTTANDLTTPANNGTIFGATYQTVTFDQTLLVQRPIYASQFASLANINASGKSISDLRAAEFLVNARSLDLSSNNLDDSDVTNLVPRTLSTGPQAGEQVGLAHLQSLDLTGNGQLRSLASVIAFHDLQSLELEGTRIDVATPATIAALGGLSQLSTLTLPTGVTNVGQNLVTTEGAVTSLPFTLRAIELNGTDHIATTNAAALGLQGSFTASAWIRPSGVAGDRAIFGTESTAANVALFLGLNTTNNVVFGFSGSATAQSTQTIPINAWTHVTYRYNTATNQQAIFINGVLDGTATAGNDFIGNEIVNIGRAQAGKQFDGRVDNIRIFNGVLSDTEILQNRDGSIPISGINVKLDYRFYDTPAGIATDSSANEFHGTFVSTPTYVTVTDQPWTVSGAATASGATTPVTFTPSDNGVALVRFKGDQFPVLVRNGSPVIVTTANLDLTNGGTGVKEGQTISIGTTGVAGSTVTIPVQVNAVAVDSFTINESASVDAQSLNTVVSVIAPDGSTTNLTSRARIFRDDVLLIPNDALNGATNFTTTFWLRSSKTASQTVLSTSVLNQFEVLVSSTVSSSTVTVITPGFSTPFNKPVGAALLSDNNYHHISVSRNISASSSVTQIQVVVDGVVWGTAFLASAGSELSIAENGLFVGQRATNATPTFANGLEVIGRIDDLTIWNRVLSLSEIDQIRSGKVNASDSGLRLWLPMNETSGAIVADRGPLGLDATFMPSYVSTTLSFRPILYYPFGEINVTNGNSIFDATENGNNGTTTGSGLVGTQSSVTTNLGNTTLFGNGGSSNSVAVPSLGTRPQVSIESWLRPSTFPASAAALYNTDADASTVTGAFHLELTSTGALRVTLGGAGAFSFGSSTDFPLNVFHHIVVSYNSTTRELAVYR
ncbi:MAG: LamG-like jellyroll fold domain-containing protein, partial [Pirellula sp.]